MNSYIFRTLLVRHHQGDFVLRKTVTKQYFDMLYMYVCVWKNWWDSSM